MESLKRLSPGQKYLFQKVAASSRARANILIRRANLSVEDLAALQIARERLKRSRVVINLNLHEQVYGTPMIESLLASRRLYNVFEIAHAGMVNNPSRVRMNLIAEFKLYGGTNDIQGILAGMTNTEHPNYGMLDYIGNPIGISMLGFYGWYRFVLDENVTWRSTFTPKDSWGAIANEVFPFQDIDGILLSRAKEKYWFQYIQEDGSIPIDTSGGTAYIEAQILGGIFLESDVDTLYYPETDQFNKPFFDKLRRFHDDYGIKLRPY